MPAGEVSPKLGGKQGKVLAQQIGPSAGSYGLITYVNVDTPIDNLQAIHDMIKAQGGGQVVFTCPAGTIYYPTQQVTWDPAMVGLDMGRATINISNLGGTAGSNFWITFASSMNSDTDLTKWYHLKFGGGHVIGSYVVNGALTAGPSAFRFNSTTGGGGNQFELLGTFINFCYKGISIANGSYFMRFKDLMIITAGTHFMENPACPISRNESSFWIARSVTTNITFMMPAAKSGRLSARRLITTTLKPCICRLARNSMVRSVTWNGIMGRLLGKPITRFT